MRTVKAGLSENAHDSAGSAFRRAIGADKAPEAQDAQTARRESSTMYSGE